MTQTTTTSDFIITTLPSKKDILFRLFNAGHITFDELWVLAQETVVTNYIQPTYPIYPSYPVVYGVTNGTGQLPLPNTLVEPSRH